MKPLRIPMVRFYLTTADKLLKESNYLGSLLVAATLSEMLVRELGDDKNKPLKKLLNSMLTSSKISEQQFNLFDQIRLIRNSYVHIDFNKLLNNCDGYALVDEKGTVTFLSEVACGNINPEEGLVDFYNLRVQIDSSKVMSLVKEVISTF